MVQMVLGKVKFLISYILVQPCQYITTHHREVVLTDAGSTVGREFRAFEDTSRGQAPQSLGTPDVTSPKSSPHLYYRCGRSLHLWKFLQNSWP